MDAPRAGEPALIVARGRPDGEELAAVVAVLAAVLGRPVPPAVVVVEPAWVRPALHQAPGAWTSGRPHLRKVG